jgi:hypothetical protein
MAQRWRRLQSLHADSTDNSSYSWDRSVVWDDPAVLKYELCPLPPTIVCRRGITSKRNEINLCIYICEPNLVCSDSMPCRLPLLAVFGHRLNLQSQTSRDPHTVSRDKVSMDGNHALKPCIFQCLNYLSAHFLAERGGCCQTLLIGVVTYQASSSFGGF